MQLSTLYLGGNLLTGTLPQSWGNFTKVSQFQVDIHLQTLFCGHAKACLCWASFSGACVGKAPTKQFLKVLLSNK